MNAVKILMPLLQPQVLIDFRVAILNYQHHPVTTMDSTMDACITISSHAAQRPFEPVHSDDMEFLRQHHSVFFDTVQRTSYNNNPLMYNHGGCLQHAGACGGEYRLVEKRPKDSCDWVPLHFMIGRVPILLMRSVVEFLGQGTIYNPYIQLSQWCYCISLNLFRWCRRHDFKKGNGPGSRTCRERSC